MNRTSLIRAAAGGALAALGYAVGVEPYAIETATLEMHVPRLPAAFDGYTIVQVSDLHTRQTGRRERLVARLLDALPTPDLVAVTGDMVHTAQGVNPFLTLAQSFTSRDGAFAVFGNSEHKNGVRPHAFARTLAEHHVSPLMNSHVVLTRGDARLVLAGVDDPVNDKDDIGAALRDAPADVCTVLLMHSPDPVAEAVLRGVDVVLSGHTHGGQISLPFYGPPFTHSILGRRMSSGYYAGVRLRRVVGIRPGRTQLYVTRGLGVSGLALRFLTRPELTVITLRPGRPGLKRVPPARRRIPD